MWNEVALNTRSSIWGEIMGIASEKPWDMRDIAWSIVAGSVASDGVHMKAERMIDGANHYLKLSRYDSYRGIYGHESVNELIACRLGKLLGFSMPDGMLKRCLVRIDDKEHDTYVFIARSFKGAGSRVPFEAFYVANRLSDDESPLDLCIRFGWADHIFKMFVFDYLIINRDRHGANLEVMKNGEKSLSPFFDNGLSFACSCTNDNELASFDIMEDRPVNNFIGEKKLAANLESINRDLVFNELRHSDSGRLFIDLEGVLSEMHLITIQNIIWRRWDSVKEFRIA